MKKYDGRFCVSDSTIHVDPTHALETQNISRLLRRPIYIIILIAHSVTAIDLSTSAIAPDIGLLRYLPSNTLFTRSHALHSHVGESALKAGGRLFAGHARDSPGDASNSRHSEATLLSVHDTARELVERLDMHESSQLQCLGPKSLVVALRALRRARKLMHRTGVFDLLVVPMILTDYDRPMICFNCWKRKRKSQVF